MNGKCSLIRKDFLEVILVTKEQRFGTMRLFQELEFPTRNEKKHYRQGEWDLLVKTGSRKDVLFKHVGE